MATDGGDNLAGVKKKVLVFLSFFLVQDLIIQNAFNFKKIHKDLPATESDSSIFWYKVMHFLNYPENNSYFFFERGLQEDRTKKVIEEIKNLEYELESKMKTVRTKRYSNLPCLY